MKSSVTFNFLFQWCLQEKVVHILIYYLKHGIRSWCKFCTTFQKLYFNHFLGTILRIPLRASLISSTTYINFWYCVLKSIITQEFFAVVQNFSSQTKLVCKLSLHAIWNSFTLMFYGHLCLREKVVIVSVKNGTWFFVCFLLKQIKVVAVLRTFKSDVRNI